MLSVGLVLADPVSMWQAIVPCRACLGPGPGLQLSPPPRPETLQEEPAREPRQEGVILAHACSLLGAPQCLDFPGDFHGS